MKRDMDLIRTILQRMQEGEYSSVRSNQFEGYEEHVVADHMLQLEEAGLIEASIGSYESIGPRTGRGLRLTWEGHEFLATASDLTLWDQAKKQVAIATGEIPF